MRAVLWVHEKLGQVNIETPFNIQLATSQAEYVLQVLCMETYYCLQAVSTEGPHDPFEAQKRESLDACAASVRATVLPLLCDGGSTLHM